MYDDENYFECESCGENCFNDEDIHSTVSHCLCDDCFNYFATDINEVMTFAEEFYFEEGDIHINPFLASNFTEDEINEILLRELKSSGCCNPREYAMDNEDDFCEYILE